MLVLVPADSHVIWIRKYRKQVWERRLAFLIRDCSDNPKMKEA